MKKFILLLFIFFFCSLSFEKDRAICDGRRIEFNKVLSESLFSNTKTTWTQEFSDSIVYFKSKGRLLAVSVGTRRLRDLYFFDFEKNKEWVLYGKEQPYYSYEIFGNEELKILVMDYLHENSFETHFFDRESKFLFKIKTTWPLTPSPNGKYYYSSDDRVTGNPLQVYDYEGNLLWRIIPSWSCMEAEALNDSNLVFVDARKLFLYDFNTGRQIWKQESLSIECPHIAVSKNGRDFIVFDTGYIFSIKRDGKLKWAIYDIDFPYTAVISDDGNFVAVHARKGRDNTKSTLSLLDNRKKGEILWQEVIDEPATRSNAVSLWFHNNYLQLIPDAANYFFRTGITEDMKTYIFKINQKNGKLISSHVLPGNVQLIEEKGEVTGYYQLQVISGKKVISRVEEVK